MLTSGRPAQLPARRSFGSLAGTLAAVLILPASASAHGYVEPWHEDVLRAAQSFVVAEVTRDVGGTWRASILRTLAGRPVPSELKISAYGMLGSRFEPIAGHEHPLRLEPGGRYYLMLMRDDASDRYALATPSSGYARLDGDHVLATYRHSNDKASVPRQVYEMTMTAAFRALHGSGSEGERTRVLRFVADLLRGPVADPDAYLETGDVPRGVVERFYLQHAALETYALIGGAASPGSLEPFLRAESPQVQISAARAMTRVPGPAALTSLLRLVGAEDRHPLARAMALRGLRARDARHLLPELRAAAHAMDDPALEALGVHFMDSRRLDMPPSLREAARALVSEWEQVSRSTPPAR